MSESSSDSEDFDYNPEVDGASEVSDANDSQSEKESSESDAELAGKKSLKPGKRKRRNRTKGGLKSDAGAEGESAPADATAVYDKQRADELWASFLSAKPKPEEKRKPAESLPVIPAASIEKRANGDAISKPTANGSAVRPPVSSIFSTVSVPQNASSNSNTAVTKGGPDMGAGDGRTSAASGAVKPSASANSASDQSAPNETAKRKAGIDGVLAFINKKQKLNTLEKSRLDWETFKRDADLKEELATFNRGKTGYLEKQAFLDRTDVRVFEHERDMRLKQINKRLGSGGSKLE